MIVRVAIVGWMQAAFVLVATMALVKTAGAEDAVSWLTRAASAARQQNYIGTVVYQHGSRVETLRLVHLNDVGNELEKLVNLDGPAREVIRSQGEVRCYYPEAKIVRIEPRTFRNAFPSLSPQQLKALSDYYDFRMAERGRVAGLETQAWLLEPKDGLRYGHKFWSDADSGLLIKARILDDRNDVIEQFAFTEISIGVKIDRKDVNPTWPVTPPDWQIRQAGPGDVELRDTGWTVTRVPPGFIKIVEGFRKLRAQRQVAHLVYSDGLVAVSVFVEPVVGSSAAHPIGITRQGGVNVYIRQLDDNMITVLGEVPAATVSQFAHSVARR